MLKRSLPIVIAFLLSAAVCLADEIHLKNGGLIKGKIIEVAPGISYRIRTADGSIFVFKVEEIEKITYGAVSGSRNPAMAGLLSLLLPGGGQAYNGQWGKAVGFFLGSGASAIAGVIVSEAWDDSEAGFFTYIALASAVSVGSIVDGVISASRLNQQSGLSFHIGKNRSVLAYALAF